jgi:hypothetical protein
VQKLHCGFHGLPPSRFSYEKKKHLTCFQRISVQESTLHFSRDVSMYICICVNVGSVIKIIKTIKDVRNIFFNIMGKLIYACLNLHLILRPTVSRSVCLEIQHPSGAYDQIFITVRQLGVRWCRALSLTRGRVCRLQLLLALARALIVRSNSRMTRDHISLSQIRDFPFRRLLRLAGQRWKYSNPLPHGNLRL